MTTTISDRAKGAAVLAAELDSLHERAAELNREVAAEIETHFVKMTGLSNKQTAILVKMGAVEAALFALVGD